MTMLVAHLRALKTWFFFGGWHRLFLFLSSVPILWLFWGICCPSFTSGEIDFKNTFLSLFAAWYSLLYLQDFTNNDHKLVNSGSYHLPTCPSLPISPMMRMGAELLFFLIISILVFIPLFLLFILFTPARTYQDLTPIKFLLSAIQGTLAIAPIVFCIRMNANGTFILPAILRMVLPAAFSVGFILFQITGLFITLTASIVLFISQAALLCLIFIWFLGPHNRLHNSGWMKHIPLYMVDDIILTLLFGKSTHRNYRSPENQILMDFSRIITLYMVYWICVYLPLMGILYYISIHILDKPIMYWFIFFLLLLLPTQDSHALKDRFIIPFFSLPLRQNIILQRFYLIFTIGIALIWALPMLFVSFFDRIKILSYLPIVLSFAPTAAGIWVNRILNKRLLVILGMLMICCLPFGYYLNLVQEYIFLFYLAALIGALLPYRSMTIS